MAEALMGKDQMRIIKYRRLVLSSVSVAVIVAMMAAGCSGKDDKKDDNAKSGDSTTSAAAGQTAEFTKRPDLPEVKNTGTQGQFLLGSYSDCFWYAGAVGVEPENNIAYPDAGATYWAAYYRRPAGSKLYIEGTFAFARYVSLISYDGLGQPVDGVADFQMIPKEGSTNPFKVGANRLVPVDQRQFSVEVIHETNPGFTIRDPRSDEKDRESLYTVPAEGATPLSHETGSDGAEYDTELLLWRVYIPNKGLDITGGVGLPQPRLVLADGTELTGQALCDAVDGTADDYKVIKNDPTSNRLPDISALLIPPPTYDKMRYPNLMAPGEEVTIIGGADPLIQVGRPLDHPESFPADYHPGVGDRSTSWRSQYNRKYLLQFWTGDDAPGADPNPSRIGGGFFPNIHNNYTRTALHRSFGKVAVLRGKMPTAPTTYNDDPIMGSGQVRYVSYCITEAVVTTRVANCAYDEDVPIDADRMFTIVVSKPEDRPKNATAECGVRWMEWSPNGDGYKDLDFSWFQIRNMLPDADFDQAIQSTKTPGDEVSVMGDYLPDVEYFATPDDFDKLPCEG